MSAKFITGVITAAALIAAIAAAPAQARNNNDLRTFVIGAGSIFLLHELLNNRDSGGSKKKADRRDSDRGKGGHGDYSGRSGHGAKKAPIPRQCVRRTGGKKHGQRVATRNCLKHNYRSFKRLPQACKTNFWQRGNKRKGYELRCLKNHGFRVSGRR